MPRAISRCPRCGEPVTPFAAGCAICGADLERARAELATKRRIELPRPTARLVGGGPVGARVDLDWVHIAVAVVLALAAPPVGFGLALYWAFQRRRGGQSAMVAVMLAVAGLAAAALVAPVWFWSHVLGGL